MADDNTPARKSAGSGGGNPWGGGLIALGGVYAVVKFLGCGTTDKPTPAVPADPPHMMAPSAQPIHQPSPVQFSPPVAVARLHVSGEDGTAELQQLAAGMTRGEAAAFGLGVLLTGTDTYAARIRITNTGSVPVRVYPENLLVHFGSESAVVTTISHPSFLQRGVLQPGYFCEGLVMYRARVDIGVAMRLAGGGLSYNDDTIQVTYNW